MPNPLYLKKHIKAFLHCVLSGLIDIYFLCYQAVIADSVTCSEHRLKVCNSIIQSESGFSGVQLEPLSCHATYCVLAVYYRTLWELYCIIVLIFIFFNFSLLDGGHASGFKEGKKKFKKALLQVKGKRKVYASQVSLVSFWIKIMQTSCIYRVRTLLESPWIAVLTLSNPGNTERTSG